MLTNIIARYQAAKAVWEIQFDEDCEKASNSVEWWSYMNLGHEIIIFHCSTLCQVQQKAKFILEDANLLDELTNSSCQTTVPALLKSIAGQAVGNLPVNNVDNGEKRS